MKITERRLRSIIRSVIRESRRDSMSDFELGQAGMKRYRASEKRREALEDQALGLGDGPDYDPAEGQPSDTLFNISGDRPTEPYLPPPKKSMTLLDAGRANSYLQNFSPLKSRIQGKVRCKSSDERFPDGWRCSVKLSEDGGSVDAIIHMSFDGDIEVEYV